MMRAQCVILALAFGLGLWMRSSFLATDTPNLPTRTDRLTAGLPATAPLLLVAFAAARAFVRNETSRPGGVKIEPLLAGPIASTIWAFGFALSMG